MKIRTVICLVFVALAFVWADGVKWVETQKWSARGAIETETFELVGDDWKVVYSSKFKESVILQLIDAETNEIITYGVGSMKSGSTYTMRGKSQALMKRKVFLRINGSFGAWSASFSQYVSEVTAYEVSKARKNNAKLSKYGAWCGNGGETFTIPLTIPNKEWKLVVKSEGSGSFMLKCADADEKVLVSSHISGVGEISSWVHTTKNVTIELKSIATPWVMTVEVQ